MGTYSPKTYKNVANFGKCSDKQLEIDAHCAVAVASPFSFFKDFFMSKYSDAKQIFINVFRRDPDQFRDGNGVFQQELFLNDIGIQLGVGGRTVDLLNEKFGPSAEGTLNFFQRLYGDKIED